MFQEGLSQNGRLTAQLGGLIWTGVIPFVEHCHDMEILRSVLITVAISVSIIQSGRLSAFIVHHQNGLLSRKASDLRVVKQTFEGIIMGSGAMILVSFITSKNLLVDT